MIDTKKLEELVKGQRFTTFSTQVDDPDFQYVAAACNAVPELLSENKMLREQVSELQMHKNKLAKYLETLCRYLGREGIHCPHCSVLDLCKSCGDMKRADWIQSTEG